MAQQLYTFLFCDLMTNAVLAEIPLSQVSFENRLNDAGTFSGVLTLGDPRIAALDPFGSTQPGRTAIYVDRGGKLVWGGVLWTRRFDSNSKALQLSGNEFWSYFKSRLILANLTFIGGSGASSVGDDQLAIARYLINQAQATAGGNIGGFAARSVQDAVVTANSSTVTSATANFQNSDVGASVGCAPFPIGTTI